MTDLDKKILDEFWDMCAVHNPGRNKDDFRVHWREGYAFYYDIIDRSTGKSVMSLHADVTDPKADGWAVMSEIAKATAQIMRGDAEVVTDIDSGPPRCKAKPKHVSEWLKDYE